MESKTSFVVVDATCLARVCKRLVYLSEWVSTKENKRGTWRVCTLLNV